MMWHKIPETSDKFPKWLKLENLNHNYTRVIWKNDSCGCTVLCLSGLRPHVKHACQTNEVELTEEE